MTVVFGLSDRNPRRRAQVLDQVDRELAMSFYGAHVGGPHRWRHDTIEIAWSCNGHAPISMSKSAPAAAWILGHYAPEQTASAAEHALLLATKRSAVEAVCGQNGYYLACHVGDDGTVHVGTDTLGLFPLYYASGPDFLAFSTEPRLLLLHPRVDASPCIDGLSGVLLQGRCANGRTLHRGVRRPTHFHGVRWRDGVAREVAANPLLPTDAWFGEPYGAVRERFSETLRSAIASLTPGDGRVNLMLSGGIDSRLLAALMHPASRASSTATVFGARGDSEVRCATAVARAVRMPMLTLDARYDRFPARFEEMALREGCMNTMQDLSWLSAADAIAATGAPLMSGLHGDAVAGFSGVPFFYDSARGEYSWQAYWSAGCTAYGVPAADVEALVNSDDVSRAIPRVREELRAQYDALPGLPFQRSLLWGLVNRSRYHNSAFAFRLSAAAWPLQPFIDRRLLDLMTSVSLDAAGDRRLELDTLITDFPALARLRVDRNGVDDRPLLRRGARAGWERLRLEVRRRVPRAASPLTYYRTFDIANAGWQGVRESVERHRAEAGLMLRPPALNALLPSPPLPIAASDAIVGTASHKHLLALMTYFAQHTPTRHADLH